MEPRSAVASCSGRLVSCGDTVGAPAGAGLHVARHKLRSVNRQPTTVAHMFCVGAVRRQLAALSARKVSADQAPSLQPVDQHGDTWVPENDPEFLASINELCNSGVRAMLSGDRRAVIAFRDELDDAGAVFAEEGITDALTFCYVLLRMTENKLVKQSEMLEGLYQDAFMRMFAILEDSGWQMAEEKLDGGGAASMVEGELMQPPPPPM